MANTRETPNSKANTNRVRAQKRCRELFGALPGLRRFDGVREFVALRLNYPEREHTTAADERKRR